MNISLSSYLPTVFHPCDGGIKNIPDFFKCLYHRERTVKRTSDVSEISLHLQNDIGMSQGQRMAARLAPVLDTSLDDSQGYR